MLDIISVFKGAINPAPVQECSWQDALANIQSGKYHPAIDRVRKIRESEGEQAYKEAKKKLPAVTFCANFSKNRDHTNVISATGFIIPDLDHLPNVDEVFNLLCQDEHIWFIFRSPSGDGLKCGIRATGIYTDEDIKKFYLSCEHYFKSIYGLQIDPSCKDIARLTFVSSDPQLFKNPAPVYFDIEKWLPVIEERFYQPPDFGNNGWKSKYGQKVLEGACQKIKDAPQGQRHPERLKQSRLVGGFIRSEFIDESVALSMIENALHSGGTPDIETAMKTVRDGIEYGKQKPIYPEERIGTSNKDDIQFYCDPDEVFENVSNVSNVSNDINASKSTHDVSEMKAECKQESAKRRTSGPHNLAGTIKEWIENSKGYFTVDQIDREFCLTTRTEKNNRSVVLNRLCVSRQIKKHKNIIGRYEIVDHSLNTVDIFNVNESPFEIELPFDLHRFCSLPQKCIVVLAGSGNAGKTAIALNIAKLNLHRQYKKYYLASEMGGGEIVDRLRRFKDVPFCDWAEMTIAERSFDFASVIEAHNPDGLTLIDFLEEVDGEYNKITSQIRNIYDALGNGVAVVGIQKRNDQDFARGGQGTAEKARLYVSVDTITVVDNQPVCAIKIIKMKRWMQRNLNFHELHFKIVHGAEIEVLSDWMMLKPGERERYKNIYESHNPEKKKEQMDEWVYTFKTKTGKMVGINEETFENWSKTYSKLNLYDTLEQIANSTFQKQWMNDKGWIYQLTGMLAKRNEAKP